MMDVVLDSIHKSRNMNKEIELPIVPQRIAIISSKTAAGYGDFIDQLDNNPYRYKVNYSLFTAISLQVITL